MNEPQTPTEGRIVNFVTADGSKIQPAIIVNAWERKPDNYLNLIVFRDGTNDNQHDSKEAAHTSWETSVSYDPEGKKGRSWHWPQKSAVAQAEKQAENPPAGEQKAA